MWQTYGHQNAKTILERFLERKVFPHALLFMGPSGVGKRTLALEYAAHLLGDPMQATGDILTFDAAASDIEQTRHFLQQLALTPAVGNRKVAIIDNVDAAGAIIGNALLKTLEEPSASTHLILIAGSSQVLPTIASRCQALHFNRLSETELAEFAAQLQPAATPEMVALSSGRPGQLQLFSSDPEHFAKIQTNLAILEQAANGTQTDQLTAITSLADMETDELGEVLRIWLNHKAAQLSDHPPHHFLVSRILESVGHLNGTFNKKLVLQRLLLRSKS